MRSKEVVYREHLAFLRSEGNKLVSDSRTALVKVPEFVHAAAIALFFKEPASVSFSRGQIRIHVDFFHFDGEEGHGVH